jgi:defect-in-organelle-trafficking protein DotC
MAMSKHLLFKSIAFSCVLLCAAPAMAAYDANARDEPRQAAMIPPEPQSMEALQEVRKSEAIVGERKSDPNDKLADAAVKEEQDLALKIRRDAMKEAALSFGARGGLAWRTKHIMDELKTTEGALDKTFDFRRLLIQAPSNMFIEPPIVSEAQNNFLVTPDGNEAAVADTIYHISRQARIVSSPRNWRQYLERYWKEELAPPPDILLPENEAERKAWRLWVSEGWREGYKQADEIFQADVNRLIADFEGMVRYRILLAQNKITPPYATMEDRGVSGNEVQTMVGNKSMNITTEMRVGDRAIRITQPATLRPQEMGSDWTPPARINQ